MDTWSPLFSSIVASSVWGMKPHIKVVWVTMLAMKDRHGFVGGSVPGLARLSVVSPEECREALAMFESPDPDSRNSDNEGRKIKVVEGGWIILGHERFQSLMKEVSTQIGNAKRQKALRGRRSARGNGGAIAGESAHQRLVESGASQAELDRHVTQSLPPECQ